MAGACRLLSVPLPLLKAHRFSHSLERAGQEWLSAELAMGAACGECELSGGDEAGTQLGILARMGLPARGAGAASKRGGDCCKGLPDTSADGSLGLGWGAGVSSWGAQVLQAGGRPSP